MELIIICTIISFFILATIVAACYFYHRYQQQKLAHLKKKKESEEIDRDLEPLLAAHSKRNALCVQACQCNNLIRERAKENNSIVKENNNPSTENTEFTENNATFQHALNEFLNIDYQLNEVYTKNDVLRVTAKINDDNMKFEKIFQDILSALHNIINMSEIKNKTNKKLVAVNANECKESFFANKSNQSKESTPLLAPTPPEKEKDINTNPTPPPLSHNKK